MSTTAATTPTTAAHTTHEVQVCGLAIGGPGGPRLHFIPLGTNPSEYDAALQITNRYELREFAIYCGLVQPDGHSTIDIEVQDQEPRPVALIDKRPDKNLAKRLRNPAKRASRSTPFTTHHEQYVVRPRAAGASEPLTVLYLEPKVKAGRDKLKAVAAVVGAVASLVRCVWELLNGQGDF